MDMHVALWSSDSNSQYGIVSHNSAALSCVPEFWKVDLKKHQIGRLT